jgi:hypothetical protein
VAAASPSKDAVVRGASVAKATLFLDRYIVVNFSLQNLLLAFLLFSLRDQLEARKEVGVNSIFILLFVTVFFVFVFVFVFAFLAISRVTILGVLP